MIRANEIGVKEYGNDVTVAENDVAKLMYYLNCVCRTVNCSDDRELSRYTNYHDWASLSRDDQKRLLVLCYTFSPDVFEDKVFFQSEALCRGAPNRLYEVSQVRHEILAVSNIIVAGRSRQVTKIMTYTMPWMHYCYLQPMQGLAQSLTEQEQVRQPQRQALPQRQTQRQPQPQPQRQPQPQPQRQPQPPRGRQPQREDGCTIC